MDTPIHGHFTWTEDEFLTAAREMNRDRRSRSKRRETTAILGFAVFLGSCMWINARNSQTSFEWVLTLGLIPVVLLFGRSLWRRWMANGLRARFQKLPDAMRPTDWYASDREIVLCSPSGETRTSWAVVEGVEETEPGFLVRIPVNSSVWLPKHSFENPQDIERFRLLVKERSAKHEKAAFQDSLSEL